MNTVILLSALLLLGLVVGQWTDLNGLGVPLPALTMTALAFIMIKVGLEFQIDKTRKRQYGLDYLVAAGAATVPWLFSAAYFMFVFGADWREALLVGRFAAPTSAGVLLSMLVAAGLNGTWVFAKARILAVFDDLDTVFFMIPFQIFLMGFEWGCFTIIALVVVILIAAYKKLHMINLPTGGPWLLLYSGGIYGISVWAEHSDLVHHLEVLVPAFALGCVLRPGNGGEKQKQRTAEKNVSAPREDTLDRNVKLIFMFLVGASIPRLDFISFSPFDLVVHIVLITLLGLLGKCLPLLFYRREADIRNRAALSIAMFPRGEVGAGILIIALGHGFQTASVTFAGLSLALNLILTGLFVYLVTRLTTGTTLQNRGSLYE